MTGTYKQDLTPRFFQPVSLHTVMVELLLLLLPFAWGEKKINEPQVWLDGQPPDCGESWPGCLIRPSVGCAVLPETGTLIPYDQGS